MNTVETHSNSPVQHALKSGLYVGVINAIILILLYIIDPTLMASLWLGIGIILLNLFLVVYFGIQYRKEVGGYLSFGPAFFHGFITLVTAGIIGLIFRLLLFTVIAPDLTDIVVNASVENTVSMMESMGVSAQDIDTQVEIMEESVREQYTFSGMFISFLWSILIYAIVALITGAIVRKSEPIENY